MSNRAGTAPDPRQMGAGPEMDRAVALSVMGWTIDRNNTGLWIDLSTSSSVVCNFKVCGRVDQWSPSRNIAECWDVHGRIHDLGLGEQWAQALAEIVAPSGVYCMCRCCHYPNTALATATASAEDRCRAALWVVGERA